jgi:hypothetical protein
VVVRRTEQVFGRARWRVSSRGRKVGGLPGVHAVEGNLAADHDDAGALGGVGSDDGQAMAGPNSRTVADLESMNSQRESQGRVTDLRTGGRHRLPPGTDAHSSRIEQLPYDGKVDDAKFNWTH